MVRSSDENAGPQSSAAVLPPLGWRCWPLRQPGAHRWLVPLGLAAVGMAAGVTTGRTWWGFAGPLLLALAAWRFFVPVRYELGQSGITERTPLRQRTLRWTAIRSYVVRQQGLTLALRPTAIPLDALGTFYLPWGDRHDEVLDAVRHRLGPGGDGRTAR